MDVAVSPVREEIVLPIKAETEDTVQQPSLQEHIQERIVKQEVDIPVPLVMEDFVAAVHQERGQQRIAVQ